MGMGGLTLANAPFASAAELTPATTEAGLRDAIDTANGNAEADRITLAIAQLIREQIDHAVIAIDALTGKVEIVEYHVGHDCGTVINPDIVRGMTLGGIAQSGFSTMQSAVTMLATPHDMRGRMMGLLSVCIGATAALPPSPNLPNAARASSGCAPNRSPTYRAADRCRWPRSCSVWCCAT